MICRVFGSLRSPAPRRPAGGERCLFCLGLEETTISGLWMFVSFWYIGIGLQPQSCGVFAWWLLKQKRLPKETARWRVWVDFLFLAGPQGTVASKLCFEKVLKEASGVKCWGEPMCRVAGC